MRAIGGNALVTNFGRWIWGNQISLPKATNVIAVVGTKFREAIAFDMFFSTLLNEKDYERIQYSLE